MHKLFVPLSLLLCGAGFAQKSIQYSQYYYLYAGRAAAVVPAVAYEGGNSHHFGVRYNFEASQTFSVTAGKTFRHKNGGLQFTPSAGLLAGSVFGVSVNMQAAFEKGPFFCSTEPLYCYFFSGAGPYAYNWAEAGVQAGPYFFAGVALQSTKERGLPGCTQQPGLFAGFSIGNVELPLYVFKQAAGSAYMVLGLQWRLSNMQKQ